MNVKLTIRFTYSKTLWEDDPQVQHALHYLGFRTPEAKLVKQELIEVSGYSAIVAGNIESTKASIKELIESKYYNVKDIQISHQFI